MKNQYHLLKYHGQYFRRNRYLKETSQPAGTSEKSSIQLKELPAQLTEITIHSAEPSTQSKEPSAQTSVSSLEQKELATQSF